MTPELALADDQWRFERHEQSRIEQENEGDKPPSVSAITEFGAFDEVLRVVDPWHDCDWAFEEF